MSLLRHRGSLVSATSGTVEAWRRQANGRPALFGQCRPFSSPKERSAGDLSGLQARGADTQALALGLGVLGMGVVLAARVAFPSAFAGMSVELTLIAAAAAVLAAGVLAQAAPAAVPTPEVTGPIAVTAPPGDPSHGYPFFASDDGLAADGYVEVKGKGVTVLGFPSNDFGGQEPGSAAEIQRRYSSIETSATGAEPQAAIQRSASSRMRPSTPCASSHAEAGTSRSSSPCASGARPGASGAGVGAAAGAPPHIAPCSGRSWRHGGRSWRFPRR